MITSILIRVATLFRHKLTIEACTIKLPLKYGHAATQIKQDRTHTHTQPSCECSPWIYLTNIMLVSCYIPEPCTPSSVLNVTDHQHMRVVSLVVVLDL